MRPFSCVPVEKRTKREGEEAPKICLGRKGLAGFEIGSQLGALLPLFCSQI